MGGVACCPGDRHLTDTPGALKPGSSTQLASPRRRTLDAQKGDLTFDANKSIPAAPDDVMRELSPEEQATDTDSRASHARRFSSDNKMQDVTTPRNFVLAAPTPRVPKVDAEDDEEIKNYQQKLFDKPFHRDEPPESSILSPRAPYESTLNLTKTIENGNMETKRYDSLINRMQHDFAYSQVDLASARKPADPSAMDPVAEEEMDEQTSPYSSVNTKRNTLANSASSSVQSTSINGTRNKAIEVPTQNGMKVGGQQSAPKEEATAAKPTPKPSLFKFTTVQDPKPISNGIRLTTVTESNTSSTSTVPAPATKPFPAKVPLFEIVPDSSTRSTESQSQAVKPANKRADSTDLFLQSTEFDRPASQDFGVTRTEAEEQYIRNELLLWARSHTRDRTNIDIHDLSLSWKNGLAFCAVIASYHPSYLDYNSLRPTHPADNLNLAFSIAEEKFLVPRVVKVEEFTSKPRPDEKKVIAYLSALRHALDNPM